jgi:hypothetical protein
LCQGKYSDLEDHKQAYADNGKTTDGKKIIQVNESYPVVFQGVNVLDKEGIWISFDKDYQ